MYNQQRFDSLFTNVHVSQIENYMYLQECEKILFVKDAFYYQGMHTYSYFSFGMRTKIKFYICPEGVIFVHVVSTT